MSLNERIITQLEQLATNGPKSIKAIVQPSPAKGIIMGLAAEGDEGGVSINLVDYDRYSITVRHLDVYNNKLNIGENVEKYLRRVAAALSQRLVYLEEPLALFELNTIDGIAQLRSTPPKHSPDESTYWEIMVHAQPHPHARLMRCHWVSGKAERQAVAYPATFATVGRLAEDLSASLQEVPSDG